MVESPSFAQLEAEILELPSGVAREFLRVRELLAPKLDAAELYRWALEGREIALQSFRSWEATAEYFRVSSDILTTLLPLAYLESWAGHGRRLAAAAASLSIAYFRASPLILSRLAPDQLATWAAQGQRLYRGTWKSGTLSAHFFDTSSGLLDHMALDDLALFVDFLETLSKRSHELAEECLATSEAVFATVAREDVRPLLSLIQRTVDTSWKYAKESLEAGAVALVRVEPRHSGRFLRYTEEIVSQGGRRHLLLLTDGSRALSRLDPALHGPILELFDELRGISLSGSVEFIKSVPAVLARVNREALILWHLAGARLLADNEAAGISYFKLESGKGEALLQTLSARVELERVLPILRMYSRALTGEDLGIVPIQNAGRQGPGWASMERASTDGRSIFLPPDVGMFDSKEENFSWYKVLTTHQAGHLEFASFDFSFEREGARFHNWRVQLAAAAEDGPTTLADYQRFFDLFSDRRLAADIFTIVEDVRVDQLVGHWYTGLRRAYNGIRASAIDSRPAPEELPPREALMEILVRMSLLESPATVAVPAAFRPTVERIAAVLLHLRSIDATVEDSAEAALRIYLHLSQVPNQAQPETEWQDVDVGELGRQGSASDITNPNPEEAEAAERADGTSQMAPGEGEPEKAPYRSPEPVEYRGDFKPELVQVIANLRETKQGDGAVDGAPIDEEALRRLAAQSGEINLTLEEGEIEHAMGLFVSQLMDEILGESGKPPEPQAGRRPPRPRPDHEGPLEEEARTFLYDEWDYKANDYKPRWCRVREVPVNKGTTEFYDRTLEHHSLLISRIRRQFELMVPEMYRKVKRLEDGEEFDLDAVIEAFIEKRTGAPPTEKVYWRRNKIQRDAAVIFLLDMSASTAEAIDEKDRTEDDWQDIPDDPREYLIWLRARREAAKRSYKRIIDIERESTVLLIRALEAIGDQYGIYGFSGYGRENVEFYTIKDIGEAFTEEVSRRIDGISPLHATRMGPAIRHAASKLKAQAAKTKVLFLISDGRPQDRGYSREGVEKEYAVQDTHKALLETRALGITPFCLTVDRAGHDYMKEMCEDIAYEVLEDVTSLPERLPQLYRRLTV